MEGFSSLQCPMVSCLKSRFIRFWPAWSSPVSSVRTYIPCCSGLCLPLQPNSQGSEYVMDNSSSFSLPTGRSARGPPQEVYTMVDISHFLSGCSVPHQLHGRLVHSRFQFGHTALVASVEHTFCLPLPSSCGIEEHFMQHDQLMGSPKTPPGVLIQEKLRVHHPL